MSVRTRIVEVELPEGEIIYAEVLSTGGSDVSVADRLRLDKAGELISQVGAWASNVARVGIPEQPDKFEVSFGMKLGTKSGKLIGILAEASGEASLTVRMKWETAKAPDVGDNA